MSLAVILAWATIALVWRWTGIDPYGDTGLALAPPGPTHWFGTDHIGRDVFARVLAGAESVLAVAPAATMIAVIVGTVLGLFAGYLRGWADSVAMRALDVMFVAPAIVVLLVAITAFGRSAMVVIIAVGLILSPMIARVVRAQALAESGKEYVLSARLQGEGTARILTREVLPNVWPHVLVQATLCLGVAVFVSTSLSFLGLMAAPPSPDWGLAVSENRAYVQGAWWTVAFPCLAIVSLVVATTLVADDLDEVVRR
ncbi:ABC transporter permease [Microbacterium koreense]|uniref:ABC transporter permease n=1 Tax=Microbacterium koreense TaxID=323761 RepID=A0ABW2ZNG5_9MICO